MTRKTAQQIEVAAANWAAKVDRGLSSEEEKALEVWLSEDVRHLGAYGRIQAIFSHTERAAALGVNYDPALFVQHPAASAASYLRRMPRRYFLTSGAAAAAAIAVVAGRSLLATSGTRIETRKGEVRQVALEDGSVVTLNTASALSVSMTSADRSVTLLSGEALFDVAHDPARPFVVTAGTTYARAVGTVFVVRKALDGVNVIVQHGLVDVSGAIAAKPFRPIRLAASKTVHVPVAPSREPTMEGGSAASVAVTTLGDDEIHRVLAWRDGRLAFEGETVEQAVQEFERYSDTRIIVDDPALRRQEIAGLYQANDPIGFAQGIAASFNSKTIITDGAVHITRRMS